jgi:CRP/FNR family transcriptional regulator, cyclic AMP receptor protein
MSEPDGRGAVSARDVLDWLHEQARRRRSEVPEFDVEKTLRLLRAVRDAGAREDAATLWTSLSPADRCDIVSASRKQTFPAGTVLMREGEPADTVMVILDGRVQVSVRERGRDRAIAERRVGDLVGEHGAAPGGMRSATVTAVEPVLALVMETRDFTAFINDHPDVPDLVKQQVYDRHTDRRSRPR